MTTKLFIVNMTYKDYIKSLFKTKKRFLGYAHNNSAWCIKLPYIHKFYLQRLIKHESGHLAINTGHLNLSHHEYDRITKHGLLQSKVSFNYLPNETIYTESKILPWINL